MVNQRTPSKTLHIALWIAQIMLSVSLVWAGIMKLAQPVETLAVMWPWAGQVPASLVKFTGIVDIVGAAGLILPSLLRIQPKLTPMAAMGVIVLMIFASVFHVARGEASVIGVNIVFAAIAAFVAWGRLAKAPIPPK